jgi:hypothetical protein
LSIASTNVGNEAILCSTELKNISDPGCSYLSVFLRSYLRIPTDRTGLDRQAQTWPGRPSTRIVPDASMCAEIGGSFLMFWCTKDGPLAQF